VTQEIHAKAEQILQYTFANPDLLTESLTHASIANTRLLSNERMEFLGDAVLDLVVCHALYERFRSSATRCTSGSPSTSRAT
jgi:ribonuclease III